MIGSSIFYFSNLYLFTNVSNLTTIIFVLITGTCDLREAGANQAHDIAAERPHDPANSTIVWLETDEL